MVPKGVTYVVCEGAGAAPASTAAVPPLLLLALPASG
jgi:hypothetical protein